MAEERPTGLQVLERTVAPVRWWLWLLGFGGTLAAAAAAYAVVGASPAVETFPGFRSLYDARIADELVAALVVLALGLALQGFLSARRFARAGAVARQQRAMLDSIVAHVPDAVVVADGSGRYRANSAAMQLLGLPSESGSVLEYHTAMERLDRRNPQTGLRIPSGAGVLEAALAGRAAAMDQVITTPTGQRTVHVSGSPIPFAQGPPGGLILASDVTGRLAIQQALQAAKDELQQKNAQHLQMARAIAHDLGNALTPANMQLSILEMGKTDPKRSLPVLQRSLAQMERLVGDLSDMARLESGAMAVSVRTVNLDEALRTAVASHQPVAEGKEIQLTAGPAPYAIRADPERLGQVLSNLLTNALKFTPSGGHVDVQATRITGMVRINVTDTGFGLSPEQIARLFKPFSQVHDPTKVKERGTGLGLYICKALVERQGGEMGVASQGHGKGSTFWFTLPLEGAPSTVAGQSTEHVG